MVDAITLIYSLVLLFFYFIRRTAWKSCPIHPGAAAGYWLPLRQKQDNEYSHLRLLEIKSKSWKPLARLSTTLSQKFSWQHQKCDDDVVEIMKTNILQAEHETSTSPMSVKTSRFLVVGAFEKEGLMSPGLSKDLLNIKETLYQY